ncbi:MAG: TRAP transporter substrate-binding protein [Brevundimonas sp.]|jgi:tripartite ATP-independent transporter DctP family solute receptor|uniref:TRAP transporter substrate-binding protein n=1 Tax=Brevundimonas sp. TaxID=1871086 RepID=UPI00391DC939
MSATMNRRHFAMGLGGVSLAGLATGCAPREQAGQRILSVADVHPNGYPTVTAMQWMGEELGRLTDGRLGVRLYPSGQLGSEDDSIGLVRYQAIDMCRVAVAALNNAFPETRLLALPYVFEDKAHMRRVVDGEVGTDLLNVFESRGLVGLAYYDAAPRCLYNARRPVSEPGELRGMKIRAPLSNIFLETISAMGANATPLSFGGVFSAMQTHLIDGAENNWASYHSSRQYEVATYWSQTEHSYSPDALLISQETLERLTPSDRDLVRDVARRSVEVMRVAWDAREIEARDAVLAHGTQITEVDREAFARSVQPVIERHLAEPRVRALYDRVMAGA